MDMMNTVIAHRIIDLHINVSITMTRFLPTELFGHTLTTSGRNTVFIVQVSVKLERKIYFLCGYQIEWDGSRILSGIFRQESSERLGLYVCTGISRVPRTLLLLLLFSTSPNCVHICNWNHEELSNNKSATGESIQKLYILFVFHQIHI